MKKQDNENLIQELTSRLDWYMMEASDEEFDADQVQALMKLLDSLKSEEENKVEEELPVEEAVNDFWKYCEEREEEEKLLCGSGENVESDDTLHREEKAEQKERILRRVLRYFHRHRMVAVAAAVLIIIALGGSWEVAANAEKHGGFFWWMDKSEEGTTMITAPEGVEDSDSNNWGIEIYDSIEEIPASYRQYALQPFEISEIARYQFDYAKLVNGKHNDTIYIFLKDETDDILKFEIRIYPHEILRVRETYPGFVFEKEFEDEGITFDIFSKEEISGDNTYIMYFYYDKEKYTITGRGNEDDLQDIVIDYKNIILNY